MIPIGAFEPSRSVFNTGSSTYVLNARPKADGWGPMPSLVAYSDALPAECLGAVEIRDATGGVTQFAGTRTALYRLDQTTLAWEDVTRTSGGAYDVPQEDNWSFCRYGNYLAAVNINDEPQLFNLDGGTEFADMGGSPPKAKYCWLAGDFFVLGHLADLPERIQWSGLNDIEHWTVGEKGSDFQTFPDGNEVQGGISDRLGAFVIQRDAIRYMQFDSGSNYTFTFQPANPTRGAAAPLSIVQVGPQDFVYLSEDGFFRGAAGTPIGAEVIDDWFLGTEVNVDDISIVQGVADPYEKIVWWSYTAATGERRLIGYDWQLSRWCWSDLACGHLMSALSPSVTWDGLDEIYATISDVTEPFDSRLFKGGRPAFSAFDSDRRLASFTGPALEATAETATVELVQGSRAFVNGVRCVTTAPTFTIAAGITPTHNTAVTWKDAYAPSSATGLVPARANGRLHRFRVSIPAGTAWTHLHGVDPVVRTGGNR